MSRIVAFENVTLDGVMQAPAYADEDRRGGFEHGGWATPYADEAAGRAAASGMAETEGVLLGRVTYEDFAGVWPNQPDNPFGAFLNGTRKHVASATLERAARLGELDAPRRRRRGRRRAPAIGTGQEPPDPW